MKLAPLGFVVAALLPAISTASDTFTLNRGGDCATTTTGLMHMHNARLGYYGNDDPAYVPPDTDLGDWAVDRVIDAAVRWGVVMLKRGTVVTVIEHTSVPGIVKVRTHAYQTKLKSRVSVTPARVCFIWAADLKR
jgi:hypothetical protein